MDDDMALHYNPHRNAFRVLFLTAMGVKGVVNGFLGVRATVNQDEILPWEQVCGHLLWVSCVVIMLGLFWRGEDTRDGILACRIGYIGFAVAEYIFAFGSFEYGFKAGLTPFVINFMFATGALLSAIEVDKVVRWRIEHHK